MIGHLQLFSLAVPRITAVDFTPNPYIGESLFIECSVDGIPVPNTTWKKDGAPLENSQVAIVKHAKNQ